MKQKNDHSKASPSAVSRLVGQEAGELSAFVQNILESSTEYSIIGKDLEGKVLLWNKGARRFEGTGLGLALTRKIVELQQGTIKVESEPGQRQHFQRGVAYWL